MTAEGNQQDNESVIGQDIDKDDLQKEIVDR